VVLGKGLGQIAILAIATVLGYGAAAAALWLKSEVSAAAWAAYGAMVATSVMLGAAFIAMGCLASTLVRERGTAAGMAVGIWLFFVLIYDTALLGLLVADQGRTVRGSALDALLLLNPADAYRLFNMTASETVSVYAGMAGPGNPAAMPPALYIAALSAWIVLPFALAIAAFRRRPV
jgi:Cu-processing system permease protein